MDNDFLPPPGPPPFLTPDQLMHLATQGWLILPPAAAPDTGPLSTLQLSLDALFPLLAPFFAQPLDAKKQLYPAKQDTEFGYMCIEDEKEFLTLRSRKHEGSELEDAAAEVWADTGVLFRRILNDVASGLCLEPDVWDDVLDGTAALPTEEMDIGSGSLMRLFRYEAEKGFANFHTDLGLLTLCVGNQTGLQVTNRPLLEATGEGRWVDIDAGEMVVLAGQTLKSLTMGRVRPGIHRVVASDRERNSIVFALRHSWKHDIDLARFGGEGIVEAKKLWKKLRIGVYNVNMPKEVRDKQRAELHRLRGEAEALGQG